MGCHHSQDAAGDSSSTTTVCRVDLLKKLTRDGAASFARSTSSRGGYRHAVAQSFASAVPIDGPHIPHTSPPDEGHVSPSPPPSTNPLVFHAEEAGQLSPLTPGSPLSVNGDGLQHHQAEEEVQKVVDVVDADDDDGSASFILHDALHHHHHHRSPSKLVATGTTLPSPFRESREQRTAAILRCRSSHSSSFDLSGSTDAPSVRANPPGVAVS